MSDVGAINLKYRIASGAIWNASGRVLQGVIQFAISVALVRLLAPSDYGRVGIIMAFAGFAGILADAGLNTALVQKKVVTELDLQTVFWISVILGGTLTASSWLLAPIISKFFSDELLGVLFRTVSLNFFLGSLSNVPYALLQRGLRFRVMARIDSISTFTAGMIAVLLALAGVGVWSLVAQLIVSTLMTSSQRFWLAKWCPRFSFSLGSVREMSGFTGGMFGFLLINHWARNADNLIIAKSFGSTTAGFYNRAYSLMILPLNIINGAINQVLVPSLSSIQEDKAEVRFVYIKAIGIISLVSSPILLGLCAVAEPFVNAIYGPRWEDAIPILRILSFVGVIQSVVSSSGVLLSSQGKTSVLLFWWGVFFSGFVAAFFIGAWIGSVIAVAICYAIANVLYAYPALLISGAAVDLAPIKVIRAAVGPLFAATVMALTVYMFVSVLSHSLTSVGLLLLSTVLGTLIYFLLIRWMNLVAWNDFKKIAFARQAPAI